MNRPDTHEFDPYYGGYISLVANGNILDALNEQPGVLTSSVSRIPEDKGSFAYAPGKWTIKEVLSHLIDGERIFAYRILRISRGDETPIEGFEQDDYIAGSNANKRQFSELAAEFDLLRRANILLVNNLSDDASRRMGTASGKPVSVRALTFIMTGHVTHHLNILQDRYLA